MTYFLQSNDAPKIKAQNPQSDLSSWFGGLGAAFTKSAIENDANFTAARKQRDVQFEMAQQAAPRVGIQALNDWYTETGAGYEHIRPAPQTTDEFFAMHGNEAYRMVLDVARQQADADPAKWADMDLSDAAVEKQVNERLRTEYEDAQLTLDMMSGWRGAAEFLGGLAGITADIKNLPFLLIGGGSGSIMRVLAREAAINVAAEATFLPSQFDMAERLNIPDPDIRTQLAMAAVGGAVFGGLMEGGARAITYWKGRNVIQPVPGYSMGTSDAMVTAAENAIAAGENPLQAVQQALKDTRPQPYILENPINPDKPPLITTPDGKFTPNNADLPLGANDKFIAESEAGGRVDGGAWALQKSDPELFELLGYVTSPMSPTGDVQIQNIQRALAIGRRDIAEALADRMARESRRASEAKPGVDRDNPRYEEIRRSLAGRAVELQAEADQAAAIINAATDAPITAQAETAIDNAEKQFEADFPEMRFKYPLGRVIQKLGGVKASVIRDGEKVRTPLAEELANMGVTTRTHPFIFSQKGMADLDNIPANEHLGLAEVLPVDPLTGYFSREGLLQALGRELSGNGKTPMSGEILARRSEIDSIGRTPSEDFIAGKQADDGWFVDLNKYHFDQDQLAANEQIARDFHAFLDEKYAGTTFTDAEKAEMVAELQRSGGDAEFLVERVMERELDYAALPPQEAQDYGDIPFFGNEPTAQTPVGPGVRTGERSVADAQAEGGGAAGVADASGQTRIPGTDRIDTGLSQRQASEIAARQQQSRMGRLDQTRVENDDTTLFGGAQSDLFSDPTSKEARALQDSIALSIRDEIAADADANIKVDMGDGKGERSISSVLDELDDLQDFAEIISLCGQPKVKA